MKEILRYLVLLMFGCMLVLSCSGPINKVLSKPELTRQMADSIAARGLCLNDTVTQETVHDTTVYKDSIVTKYIDVPVPAICDLDTVIDGTRVILHNGKLYVKSKIRTEYRTRTERITNTVRDVSKETVLEKKIQEYKIIQAALTQEIKENNDRWEKKQIQFFSLLGLCLLLLFLWVRSWFR